MLEADTSSQERVRRSGSRNERREEVFAGLRRKGRSLDDGPTTALGTIIGTAATSAVGGIGAVAASEVK
jgi:hypothetical protein